MAANAKQSYLGYTYFVSILSFSIAQISHQLQLTHHPFTLEPRKQQHKSKARRRSMIQNPCSFNQSMSKIHQHAFLDPPMDDLYLKIRRRRRVPAFGSWDLTDYNDQPFSQCFESASQRRLLRHSYSGGHYLHQNQQFFATPSRRVKIASKSPPVQAKKVSWMTGEGNREMEGRKPKTAPKAVDKDLYSIPPDLLRAYTKRKKTWGLNLLRSCIQPTCVP